MDENNKNLELTPEEQNAEAEAQKEVNIDELKAKIATDLGLDPESQGELIEKLAKKEESHRIMLSKTIKQKRTWREKAQASGNPSPQQKDGKVETPDVSKLVAEEVKKTLEARDLESLNLPDEVTQEVRELAKLRGISVREAAKLPYIQSRVEEIKREERIKKAIPKRNGGGGVVPTVDPTQPLNPNDFDLSTEEGQKAWEQAKAARKRHKNG